MKYPIVDPSKLINIHDRYARYQKFIDAIVSRLEKDYDLPEGFLKANMQERHDFNYYYNGVPYET